MQLIDIHTHSQKNCICLVNHNDWNTEPTLGFCSAGIHPWDIDKTNIDQALQQLDLWAKNKTIAAIGEIGIDHCINTPTKLQIDVFLRQVAIAEQYKLPCIIHCVKAYSDLEAILKQMPKHTPWIFHSFSSSIQMANSITQKGCYVSVGNNILKNNRLQNTIKQIPNNKLFFETDNSNTNIEEIYNLCAQLLGIGINELEELIYNNLQTVFGDGNKLA